MQSGSLARYYNIIFEDEDVIVVHKMPGVAVSSARVGQKDLVSMLTKYIADSSKDEHHGGQYKVPFLGVVHRLDQPVEGLVVFSKNKKAAASLSKQAAGEDMEKIYEATIYGHMAEKTGILEDYIIKNGKTNMSEVVQKDSNKDAKYSKLYYEVLSSTDKTDKLRIKLYTGRHHQIRAQFSSRGCPLVGDMKYGDAEALTYAKEMDVKNVKLLAKKLSFIHPSTGKRLSFEI